jgi:hypothetical protein
MAGLGGKSTGYGAFTRPNLHNRLASDIAQRRRNPLHGLLVDEKILSELWFSGHLQVWCSQSLS